jgi:hypothetical protein
MGAQRSHHMLAAFVEGKFLAHDAISDGPKSSAAFWLCAPGQQQQQHHHPPTEDL